jgi:hypothetical protein
MSRRRIALFDKETDVAQRNQDHDQEVRHRLRIHAADAGPVLLDQPLILGGAFSPPRKPESWPRLIVGIDQNRLIAVFPR